MDTINKNNVVAVITTYNDYEKTLNCLEAVHNQIEVPSRIIVVDNGSQNHYVDVLFEEWKKIAKKYEMPEPEENYNDNINSSPLILLRLPENNGYPAAINAAINLMLYDTNAKAFWFLHNDSIPEIYALCALVDHTKEVVKEKEKFYDIVGSTILYADRENIMCAGGGSFSRILGQVRLNSDGIYKHNLPTKRKILSSLDFMYGASLLVRREVFEKIGLFKEEFFFSFEDVEFCIRAKKNKLKLNWAPGAIVRHIGPVPGRAAPVRSFNNLPIDDKELPQLLDYYNIRNRFYLIKKLYPTTYYLSLITLPLPLSIRWFKGHKSRFNNVIKAVKDALNMENKI